LKTDDIKKYEKLHNIDLPKDIASETGVIGSILMHPEYILKVSYLQPRMFYNRELGCIYYIITNLFNKKILEIDNFLILTEINSNKGFKEIFDKLENVNDIVEYLDSLKLVGRNSIEEYELLTKKVITVSFKRESYIKLHTLSKEIINTEEDINKTNFKLQQEIANFSKVYICNQEVKTLGEQADKIWEDIMLKRQTGFFGFPSKFPELNKYATYEKTELFLYAAPAKTAKSQILSNEAWSLAMNGVPSLYIDRELSTENHMLRMLAFLTGIPNRKIKMGELSLKEEKLIKEKIEYIKTLPYTHIYKPISDMGEMYMTIKGLKLKNGTEFLVYDYVKANDGSDGDKEYQKLGKLTDWLKNDIAGSLDLAVLGACQMDRGGTKIADSTKIERNCSTLAYVTRKTKEEILQDTSDAGNLKFKIPFNRNGAIMEDDEYINLVLNGDLCRIEQAKIPFTNNGVLPY
jgi:replicative DNA helicase